MKRTKDNFTKILYAFNLIVLLCVVISLIYSNTYRALTYDEADYVKTSLDPFFTTWFSLNTLNFKEFLGLSLSKFGIINSFNFNSIPESVDSFLLRHFHGVLPIQYLSIFTKLITSVDLARIYATLAFFVIYFIALLIYLNKIDNLYYKNIFTIFALALFLTNKGVIESFSTFNFHIFTAFLLLPYCFILNKLILKVDKIRLFLFGFITSLFWLTLETSLILTVVTVLYMILFNYQSLKKWNIKIIFLGLILGFMLINPGIFFSLDFIKSILMYAYRIFTKESLEYQSDSTIPILIESLKKYTSILILIGAFHLYKVFNTLKLSFFKKFNYSTITKSPELVIGLFYLISIMPFTLNPTYLFPGIMLLQLSLFKITTSIKTSHSLSELFYISCLLGLYITYSNLDKLKIITQQFNREITEIQLDINNIRPYCSSLDKEVVVMLSDDANLINLYLNNNCFNIVLNDYNNGDLLARINKNYIPLKNLINDNKIIYVVLSKKRNYIRKLNQTEANIDFLVYGNFFDIIKLYN